MEQNQYLDQQLSKYDEVVGDLNARLADFKDITLGLFDDEGYNAAKKDVREIKSIKKAIEDKRKELKQIYLDGGRAVDARAKELQEIVDPVLNKRIEAIDNVDREKERQRKALVMARTKELTDVGFDFSVGAYRLGVKIIHANAIESANDAEWNDIIEQGKIEKARLDEEISAKKAEDDRLAKENAELKAKLAELENVAKPIESTPPPATQQKAYDVAYVAEKPDVMPKPQLYKSGFDACRTLAIAIVENTKSKKEIIEQLKSLEA